MRAPTARAVVFALAGVAAGVTFFQLTRPGLLFGVTPDVSVYLGGATRLVHGVVPYRDFVFTQPPGFVLLATPVGLLSNVVGTRNVLALLRMLTPVLAVATVVLVGRLLRRRGPLATLAGCTVMALFPAELYAIRGPQLEPFLILLCLVGANLLFESGRDGRGRPLLAGLAFGLAVAIKLTALLPLLVALGVCARRQSRRRLPGLCGGASAGALVPMAPFVLLAPGDFVRDTIATQLGRVPAAGRMPLPVRLGDATGISAFTTSPALTVALAMILAAAVAVPFALARTATSDLERFAVGGALVVGLAQLAPARYYPHYAALLAPFLALTLGLALAHLGELRWRRSLTMVASVPLLALLVNQLVYVGSESVPDVAETVDAVIPPGGCALSDSPVDLFTSDRFQASRTGCTTMTDPQGTSLALGTAPAAAVAAWRAAFTHADYIVTAAPVGNWELPRDAGIPGYVAANFSLVRSHGLLIYVRHDL